MNHRKEGVLILIAIYISIVVVIALRIHSDPNHYTSPDSEAYLNEAEEILSNGVGSIFDHSKLKESFTIWPIGYPLLIAGTSWVTNTSVLTSSKLLNFIFLGLLFVLLYRWFGCIAWFPALYFFSYSTLEIYSHTWTDGAFLYFVVLLSYVVAKDLKSETKPLFFFKVFGCLSALFLLRYAGIIYFFFLGGVLLLLIQKKDFKKTVHYLAALLLSTVFVGLYFFNNEYLTGYYFGSHRTGIVNESFFSIILEMTQGFINEFTISRNYYFNGYNDFLYIFLTTMQMVVVYVLIKSRKLLSVPVSYNESIRLLLFSGLLYFSGMILLRFFQIITEFNYRILAPGTTLFYMVLFITIIDRNQTVYLKKVRPWIVGFMIMSLLINLPKKYLLNLFAQSI